MTFLVPTVGWRLKASDPYFSYVKLLCHFDGADGSTALVDSSPLGRTVTAQADAKIDIAQSKFGGASLKLDGVGDRVTLASSSDWSIGSSDDFTVEMWVRSSNWAKETYMYLLNGGTSGSVAIVTESSGTVMSFAKRNQGGDKVSFSWSPSNNTWYHLAWSRAGGTTYVFVDGVLQTSKTNSYSYGQNGLTIGSYDASLNEFVGWIDDLRWTKGIGRYTTAFVPPTGAHPDL